MNPFRPYPSTAANSLYNLLFCDQPEAFAPRPGEVPAPWQTALFAEPMTASAVAAIADDPSVEGRVRALAYNRLRAHRYPVPPKQSLGVVVEVGLDTGLDVLAAYAGGSVRYINHTGSMEVLERVPSLQPTVDRLLEASKRVVARIGPWDNARLAPPGNGVVRMSFLVSDGLYFGQGPMAQLQRGQLSGPIVSIASELLGLVVAEWARP